MKTNEQSLSSQLVIGLIIIAIGSLLLLDQMNIMDFGDVFQFFPSLFIALGVWQIYSNGFRHWVGPAIMIGIASVIQLSVLDVLDDGFVWRLWPLVLIAVGVSILFRRSQGGDDTVFSASETTDNSESFNIFAMFGGHERRVTSQDFRGGEATVMFGGADINVEDAQVDSQPAEINIFVMFGGLELASSPDQVVDMRVTAIFGGASDERRRQRKQLAGEQPDIIVRGVVLFGGFEITESKAS